VNAFGSNGLTHNYGILCLFNPLFRPLEPIKVINNSTDIYKEQFLCTNLTTTLIWFHINPKLMNQSQSDFTG